MGLTAALRPRKIAPATAQPRVAILGAGFGGLGMAIRLKQAGYRNIVIYERAAKLGGTWRDNTYPGSACDVPSHLYCYSFAPKRDWTHKFAPHDEILRYIEDTADRFDVRRHIRFNTEITEAAWDDTESVWRLRSAPAHGTTEPGDEFEADVLVVACGQLHRPYIPDIEGKDTFAGTSFHSARWDHGANLDGKKVAVVGNGASVVQFLPPVAKQASHVTMFQRSPNYVGPKNDLAYSDRQLWAFRHVPGLAAAKRALIWMQLESRFTLMRRNSAIGRFFKKSFAAKVSQLADDDLAASDLVPTYQPGCKRILISDEWYQTLKRPNVTVTSSAIVRIEPDAVVTGDGKRHAADVLIWGTGFQTTDFLTPMVVTGRDGVRLDETWAGGAYAHLGLAVSGFPNMFMLYGPNTNLGHNSIVFMMEQQTAYVLELLAEAGRRTADVVEVRDQAMDEYNARLQADLAKSVWADDCDSWYKTDSGLITNNWSSTTSRYRALLARVDADEYEFASR